VVEVYFFGKTMVLLLALYWTLSKNGKIKMIKGIIVILFVNLLFLLNYMPNVILITVFLILFLYVLNKNKTDEE
jgi:hypothetical protein